MTTNPFVVPRAASAQETAHMTRSPATIPHFVPVPPPVFATVQKLPVDSLPKVSQNLGLPTQHSAGAAPAPYPPSVSTPASVLAVPQSISPGPSTIASYSDHAYSSQSQAKPLHHLPSSPPEVGSIVHGQGYFGASPVITSAQPGLREALIWASTSVLNAPVYLFDDGDHTPEYFSSASSPGRLQRLVQASMHLVALFIFVRCAAIALALIFMLGCMLFASGAASNYAAIAMTVSLYYLCDVCVGGAILVAFTYSELYNQTSNAASSHRSPNRLLPFSYGLARISTLVQFACSSTTIFVCVYRIFEGFHTLGTGHSHSVSSAGEGGTDHSAGHGHGHGHSQTFSVADMRTLVFTPKFLFTILTVLVHFHSLYLWILTRQGGKVTGLLSHLGLTSPATNGDASKQTGPVTRNQEWVYAVEDFALYMLSTAVPELTIQFITVVATHLGFAKTGETMAQCVGFVVLGSFCVYVWPRVVQTGLVLMQALDHKADIFTNLKHYLTDHVRRDPRILCISSEELGLEHVQDHAGHISFHCWNSVPRVVVTFHVYIRADVDPMHASAITKALVETVRLALGPSASQEALITVETHPLAAETLCAVGAHATEVRTSHGDAHGHTCGHAHEDHHGHAHHHAHSHGYSRATATEHDNLHAREDNHDHAHAHLQAHSHGHAQSCHSHSHGHQLHQTQASSKSFALTTANPSPSNQPTISSQPQQQSRILGTQRTAMTHATPTIPTPSVFSARQEFNSFTALLQNTAQPYRPPVTRAMAATTNLTLQSQSPHYGIDIPPTPDLSKASVTSPPAMLYPFPSQPKAV